MNQVRYIEETNISKFVPTILIGSDNMSSEADNQQPSFQSNLKEGSTTKVSNSDVRDECLTIKRIPWNKGLTKNTDERVKKNVDSMTITKQNQGITGEVRPWNVGLTKETSTSVLHNAEAVKATKIMQFASGDKIPWNKGLTKETSIGVAKNADGVKQAYLEGRMINYGHSTRGGYREDLGHYVRSSWEANYSRLLRFLELTYVYEPKRFVLPNGSYLPDFYVTELDHYIEIKGFWRKDDSLRVESFRISYPDIIFYVIDEVEYEKLEEKFSKYIPTWE